MTARRPYWMVKMQAGTLPMPARKAARPRSTRRRQREGDIEETCRVHAHSKGWTSRKMNGLGFRSWPDRFFLPPINPFKRKQRGQLLPNAARFNRFWVEFKRPGEESTPDQKRMQKDLRDRGETVYECDSKEKFIEIFAKHNK